MTASRAYVLRELRLVRIPFILAMSAQLAGTLLMSRRTYALLLDVDPPVVPMLLAAWLGYHRIYAEQARGTWLVQPFSRARAIALKGAIAVAALSTLALLHASCVYAWVATASAPIGPIRPLGAYLVEATSVQLGAALAIFAAATGASFVESRPRQAVWIAAGLLWAAVVCADDFEIAYLLGPTPHSLRSNWALLCTAFIACFGTALVLTLGARLGRPPTLGADMSSALWLTPLMFAALRIVSAFASPPPSSAWQTAVVLRDGEVVVADFVRGEGGRARRSDGRWVEITPSTPEQSAAIELTSAGDRAPAFGQSWWVGEHEAFVSSDARTVLLYDRSGTQSACWGANGVQSMASCAPFTRISSLSQLHVDRALSAIQLVTSDSVVDLDVDGTVHERFRGEGVESVAQLDDGNVRAILSRDAVTLIGRLNRTCPAMPADSRLGLLDDDTLVSVHDGSITYCRASLEVSTAAWPLLEEPRDFVRAVALLFPLAHAPLVAPSTWWVAAALRAIGWLALTLVFRRRGFLVALPGVVIGPAYLLAAAWVVADGSAIGSWWARVHARLSQRTVVAGG